MNPVSEPEVLHEVPESLKRLIRLVVRGFYDVEFALVIDLLIHHPCIKEDDLLELTKFDRKVLRMIVNTLKMDKFIKTRMRMETDPEGRASRHNYYFINYTTFVNVVKYKLDHMRRKIETEERDSTNRASFKCPLETCGKSYTDLEVGELYDPMTGNLCCTFCKSEVQEEESRSSGTDARALMVKFNEQIEPIYALLRDVTDMKLAPEILEPEPQEIKALRPHGSGRQGERTTWSGDATKNRDIYGHMENQVTITMDDGDKAARGEAGTKKPQKERPVWMMESTVEGAITEPTYQTPVVSHTTAATSHLPSGSGGQKDDIMRTLMAHEQKSTSGTSAAVHIPGAGRDASDNDSDTSEEDLTSNFRAPAVTAAPTMETSAIVEEMESEDEEEATVMVGGKKVPYDEVTEDMVAQMTPHEKQEYIRIGQEMYENMYD